MTQSYTTEYHHLLILLIFSMILMLFGLGSTSVSWNSTRPPYMIHGQTLELVDSAKYLSVTTDSKLNFDNHIDAVAKKLNGTRAFLRSCSYSIRNPTYKMYITPMFEYASTVWDPHTHKNVTQLAMSQATTTTLAAALQCYVTLYGQHWSSVVITAA